MRNYLRLFIAVFMLTSIVNATPQGWTTNMKKARRQASAEKKDVLVNITGSDWCGFCVRLHDKVFSQKLFIKEAPKHFVMVEMDFPHGKELKAAQSEALKKQNSDWKKTLKVSGYPTIFLIDSKGKPFAKKVGYGGDTPEKYLEALNNLRKIRIERDKYFKLAHKAKERAQTVELLDKSLSCMDTQIIVNHYSNLTKKLIGLDKDNRLGLKKKYENMPKIIELKKQIKTAKYKKDFPKMNLHVDELLKLVDSKGSDAQDALYQLGYALRESKPESSIKAFNDALAAAPKGLLVKRIKEMINKSNAK